MSGDVVEILRAAVVARSAARRVTLPFEVVAAAAEALAVLQAERDAAQARVHEMELWRQGWEAYLRRIGVCTISVGPDDRTDDPTTEATEATDARSRDGASDSRGEGCRREAELDRHAIRDQPGLRQQDHRREPSSCHDLKAGPSLPRANLQRRAARGWSASGPGAA